ncbi:hypothetical protein GCM10010169_21460 [Micromonospora fulviviridis]|uniref:hypothetical protein n=1 Tax=Micromonospora fulviviridis TaxID=47860 RepID=UPI00166F3ACB|nr:hypothetical protein [Micromonospora fulviviridis]GGR76974.1 hypothetical protein GCM10010169_21460 [Micromonospora fulviviridis]
MKVVAWTIVRYPGLSFAVDAGDVVSVTSSGHGAAAGTLVRSSGTGASWQEAVTVGISGTVRAVDGKPVLSLARRG